MEYDQVTFLGIECSKNEKSSVEEDRGNVKIQCICKCTKNFKWGRTKPCWASLDLC